MRTAPVLWSACRAPALLVQAASGIKALPDGLFPSSDACTFLPDQPVCRGFCPNSVERCTRRRHQTDNSSAASLAAHVSPAISSAAARSAS